MREHTWKLTVGAVVAATALSACGGGDSEGDATGSEGSDAPAASGGSLLIWAGSGTGGEAIKKVAAGFGEENGVAVNVRRSEQRDCRPVRHRVAGRQRAGPGVGAHDWIGNLVQNGSIDPIPMTDDPEGGFLPQSIKGVTFNGQIYGVPYALEKSRCIRNTTMAPEATDLDRGHGRPPARRSRRPARPPRSWCCRWAERGRLPHVPVLQLGRRIGLRQDPGRRVRPQATRARRSPRRRRHEKIAALGETGQDVLKRRSTATQVRPCSPTARRRTWSAVRGTCPPCRSPVCRTISPVPGFEGGSGLAVRRRATMYIASKGKNKAVAQEFATNYFPTPEVATGVVRRRPAAAGAEGGLRRGPGEQPGHQGVARPVPNGQIMPAITAMAAMWEPWGKAEAAIVGGADPETMTETAAPPSRPSAVDPQPGPVRLAGPADPPTEYSAARHCEFGPAWDGRHSSRPLTWTPPGSDGPPPSSGRGSQLDSATAAPAA